MIKRITIVLAVVLFSVQLLSAEEFTVRWGLVLPLSGSAARSGVDIKRGFEMAIKDLGDSRVKHELFIEDSQYDYKTSVTVAQKLISVDKVDILVALLGYG